MTAELLTVIALLCAQSKEPSQCHIKLIDCYDARAFAHGSVAIAKCVAQGATK
jgi:hypothetical protein